MADGSSEMEGSSKRKTTLRKSDVTGADSGGSCLLETECDEMSELDSREYGFLGESSQYQRYVSSSR